MRCTTREIFKEVRRSPRTQLLCGSSLCFCCNRRLVVFDFAPAWGACSIYTKHREIFHDSTSIPLTNGASCGSTRQVIGVETTNSHFLGCAHLLDKNLTFESCQRWAMSCLSSKCAFSLIYKIRTPPRSLRVHKNAKPVHSDIIAWADLPFA